MQASNWLKSIVYLSVAGMLAFSACSDDITENLVYDNVIYQLDTVAIYGSAAEKTRQKTPEQYISILYADLFRRSISSDEMNDLSILIYANGDKAMINQLIISGFLVEPDAQVPSNADMRADIERFIQATYVLFFLRNPTEYERFFLKNLIESDLDLRPEVIYTSFALSNEYQFY